MSKYLISFNDGDMEFPAEDIAEMTIDAHAVMREAVACRCAQEVRKIMDDPEQEK